MTVHDIVGKVEDIYDYIEYSYVKTLTGKLHVFSIGFFLFVAVLLTTVLIVKKIFNRKKTSWERVQEQLEELHQKYTQGLIKTRELYFHLTEVVKCLVESRFNLKVLSKTDSEFLQLLEDSAVDSEFSKSLEELFKRAQASKFASFDQVEELVLQDILLTKTSVQEWSLAAKKK